MRTCEHCGEKPRTREEKDVSIGLTEEALGADELETIQQKYLEGLLGRSPGESLAEHLRIRQIRPGWRLVDLPLGQSFQCMGCRSVFEVQRFQPGMHLGVTFEQITVPGEHPDTVQAFSGELPEWYFTCARCGQQACVRGSEYFAPSQNPGEPQIEFVTGTHSCPACRKPLGTESALMCVHCGLQWYTCPECSAAWQRGSKACQGCGKSLEQLVNLLE